MHRARDVTRIVNLRKGRITGCRCAGARREREEDKGRGGRCRRQVRHAPDDRGHFLVLADDGFLSTGELRSPMCLAWSQPRTTSAAKLVSGSCPDRIDRRTGRASVGGGQVQVAQDARRPCAAGAASLAGDRSRTMNRWSPILMRASIAVFPRVDGTSCQWMPWPLKQSVESADEIGDLIRAERVPFSASPRQLVPKA